MLPLLPFCAVTLNDAGAAMFAPSSTTTFTPTAFAFRKRVALRLRSSVAPAPPVMVERAGKFAHCDTSEFGGGYERLLIEDTVREDTDAVLNDDTDCMPCGICMPLIDEKVPAWASSTTEEIVLTTCRVLNTVSVVVLISLHTRFVIRAEPALIVCVLRSEPLIDELPFILSVEIAASSDQSAIELSDEFVATGTPLSSN